MIRLRILGCFAILLITGTALAQMRSPFSADMRVTAPNGMTSTGKLYFNGSHTRMEMTAQGHQSIVISDQDKKVAYILMPQQHMYMEIANSGAHSAGPLRGPNWRMYDPASPCANVPDLSCQKLGTEAVNDRSCTKWLFTGTSSKAGEKVTTWIDEKTGIPIKSQSAAGVMELTNIQQGPQSASLFAVPAGYQKMDMGGMMQNMHP